MGPYCNQGGQAQPLEAMLTAHLGERCPAYRMRGPLVWEIASCLSMCGAGPNAVTYPDGRSHHALTVPALAAIIRELIDDETDTP
jgi:(2Fe-2S) ferredoxin